MCMNVKSFKGKCLDPTSAPVDRCIETYINCKPECDAEEVENNTWLIINSELTCLLDPPFSSANERLGPIQNHEAISFWPMYLDGEKHKNSRKELALVVKKMMELTSGGFVPKNKGAILTGKEISDSIIELYASIFETNTHFLKAQQNTILQLHKSVVKGDIELVDNLWNKLKYQFNVSPCQLSKMTFVLGDTMPSLRHACICAALHRIKREGILGFDESDYVFHRHVSPFKYMSRSAVTDIELSNLSIPKGARLIFPIIKTTSNSSQYLYPLFGAGIHRCPAKELVPSVCRYVASNLHFNYSEFKHAKVLDDGGTFYLDDLVYKSIEGRFRWWNYTIEYLKTRFI
jgi:hypothetical protein